jgi:branched-chain amino acid transport system ATP-binding protein
MTDGSSSGKGRDGLSQPYQARAVVLEGNSLQVTYNGLAVAIDGVSLTVPEASIVAILGSNGAGKTTTLRALSGFLPSENGAITGGRVVLYGKVETGRSPNDVAADGMLLVPERDKVFATLTVEENLAAVPTRSGGDRQAMLAFVFEIFPALSGLTKRLGGLLSGGERQMLAIAKALVADPKVLLIDELSLGIAPTLVSRMMQSLVRIRDLKGISILMVEQNAVAALQIADHAYIMQSGRIVLEGEPGDLLGNPEVQRSYLGLGDSGQRRAYGERRSRRANRWDV